MAFLLSTYLCLPLFYMLLKNHQPWVVDEEVQQYTQACVEEDTTIKNLPAWPIQLAYKPCLGSNSDHIILDPTITSNNVWITLQPSIFQLIFNCDN